MARTEHFGHPGRRQHHRFKSSTPRASMRPPQVAERQYHDNELQAVPCFPSAVNPVPTRVRRKAKALGSGRSASDANTPLASTVAAQVVVAVRHRKDNVVQRHPESHLATHPVGVPVTVMPKAASAAGAGRTTVLLEPTAATKPSSETASRCFIQEPPMRTLTYAPISPEAQPGAPWDIRGDQLHGCIAMPCRSSGYGLTGVPRHHAALGCPRAIAKCRWDGPPAALPVVPT